MDFNKLPPIVGPQRRCKTAFQRHSSPRNFIVRGSAMPPRPLKRRFHENGLPRLRAQETVKHILTHNLEIDYVGLGAALDVPGHAGVPSGGLSSYTLQHQGVVREHHAGSDVVMQLLLLNKQTRYLPGIWASTNCYVHACRNDPHLVSVWHSICPNNTNLRYTRYF